MIEDKQRVSDSLLQDYVRYLKEHDTRSPEMFKNVENVAEIAKQAIHKTLEDLPCKPWIGDSKRYALSRDIYSYDEPKCVVFDILARASSKKDYDLRGELEAIIGNITAEIKSGDSKVTVKESPTQTSFVNHTYSQIDICPNNDDPWSITIRLAGFRKGDITSTIFIYFYERLLNKELVS
jgi:hypothetical protein